MQATAYQRPWITSLARMERGRFGARVLYRVTAALVKVAHHLACPHQAPQVRERLRRHLRQVPQWPLNSSDSYRALRPFVESGCLVPGVMAHLLAWARSLVDGACRGVVSHMTQGHVTWFGPTADEFLRGVRNRTTWTSMRLAPFP